MLGAVSTAPQRGALDRRRRGCAPRSGRTIGIDPAVPVVRALLRGTVRPDGAAVPSEITVFAPALALAGLLPESS